MFHCTSTVPHTTRNLLKNPVRKKGYEHIDRIQPMDQNHNAVGSAPSRRARKCWSQVLGIMTEKEKMTTVDARARRRSQVERM